MRSLVIDDEFVALNKLVGLLTPFGQCDAATSGCQALEMFCRALKDTCPYRLVTIDINMPDINGIVLLGRLQQAERVVACISARKLMVTAASSESHVLAAATGDCDGFLVKPVRRTVLLQKLQALGLVPAAPVTVDEERGARS
jgi:two-component system, chemotaxis family, chemotaxis protein CheY